MEKLFYFSFDCGGTDAVKANSVEQAKIRANKAHKCDLGHSCFAEELSEEQYNEINLVRGDFLGF